MSLLYTSTVAILGVIVGWQLSTAWYNRQDERRRKHAEFLRELARYNNKWKQED